MLVWDLWVTKLGCTKGGWMVTILDQRYHLVRQQEINRQSCFLLALACHIIDDI